MNRIEDYEVLKNRIVEWIKNYAESNGINSLVVGVSGGIDSAVTSTLAAETGLITYCIGMPLHQKKDQESLSDIHLDWLGDTYWEVITEKFNLTDVFDTFNSTMRGYGSTLTTNNDLALANSRARLRMTTLYQVAGAVGGLVVGTGNKVEDYGIGFYTKYGDGGVDIAPIADLYKTEVRELAGYLGVRRGIIDAKPTDGLWEDGRSDSKQLGMTYQDLEKAMKNKNDPNYKKYLKIREKNLHKMNPIPVCKFDNETT